MKTNILRRTTRPWAWLLILFLVACAPAFVTAADGNGNNNGKGKGNDNKTPTIDNRPVIEPRQPTGTDSNGKGKGKPEKPDRANDKEPTPGVKDLVNQFQTARETYLAEQRQLKLQLKAATEEERDAIRQKIRDSLDRWKSQHQQFVEEVKDRAKEMKSNLSQDFGRVIDQGKDEGRGRER